MGATQIRAAMPTKPLQKSVMGIEARRGWLALDLGELWAYRDLVCFFVCRDRFDTSNQ